MMMPIALVDRGDGQDIGNLAFNYLLQKYSTERKMSQKMCRVGGFFFLLQKF